VNKQLDCGDCLPMPVVVLGKSRFKTKLKLGKLYFDRSDFVSLTRTIRELHATCLNEVCWLAGQNWYWKNNMIFSSKRSLGWQCLPYVAIVVHG
jgi:hypothetical protein